MRSCDRDRLRTAANVVGVLLLIGVVAPFVVYGAPQVVGADHGFVVLSGSMEPAMSPGDAVIVREAAPEDVAEGDIITYGTDGDTPTTHRVVDVVERGGGAAYVTKGDANEDPDTGTVSHDRLIGEVLFVIPLIGYVVQFANTATGFVALVAVPLGLFVLSELRTLVRSIDEGGVPDDAGNGDVAESAGVDVESDDPSDGDDDRGGSSITLTRSSLLLLAFVFGAYVPYSAYVAYTAPEAWSIGAAVATGIGFLFSVGLYLGSGGSSAPRTARQLKAIEERPRTRPARRKQGGTSTRTDSPPPTAVRTPWLIPTPRGTRDGRGVIRVSDGRERRLGLSRRRLLYGVAAIGAAASSGSGVAALLADDERTGAKFTGGTLDLSVDVQSPESWDNGPYDAAIAPNGSQEAEFDLSVDDNPAYVWLVAPCPTCEKYENRVNVTLELTDRSDGFEYELFDDSLRSFRQAYSSGRPLSESALRPGETWTVSFTWDLTGSVPDDVGFDFEFRAVQERHIDDPESHALDVDHAPCDGCDEGDGGGESECGKDVSFVAFCSEGDGMAKIEPGDVEFERKRCGDTDRHATLNVEALPAHATHVLLKSATGLDVFEYDGEGTPFTVTSGGANAALELDGSYEQDGNVFVGSGDPPRKTGDPCPGGYWYKYDFDGGEESFGAPGDDTGGDNDDT